MYKIRFRNIFFIQYVMRIKLILASGRKDALNNSKVPQRSMHLLEKSTEIMIRVQLPFENIALQVIHCHSQEGKFAEIFHSEC